jgi:3-phenylpropionate/trans-cinnamate dioxygenase ferredoxin reductase subunit
LRLGLRTAAIDATEGIVTVEGGERLQADSIVLATGSEPLRPNLPGLDHPSVLTMRTLPDSLVLAARTQKGGPVVVIGTGFIGCEIAGSLAMRGASVTLIGQEKFPQLQRLGEGVGRRIAGWLLALGVELVAPASVSAVRDAQTVELEDGRSIAGSCVVLGMGVRPRARLGQAAGLELQDGAIVVDETMRAAKSCDRVLAVGDVAYAFNASAGRGLRVEHWGDALGHGEVAGRALAGGGGRWDSVPGFWSTIGGQTLKYAAWGDGYEETRLVDHGDRAFTAWYTRDGAAVGVLTHERDEDYERGRELIRRGEPAP